VPTLEEGRTGGDGKRKGGEAGGDGGTGLAVEEAGWAMSGCGQRRPWRWWRRQAGQAEEPWAQEGLAGAPCRPMRPSRAHNWGGGAAAAQVEEYGQCEEGDPSSDLDLV